LIRGSGVILGVVVCASLARAQGSFVNWETPQTHPVEMTPDGTKLLVLDTPAARLLVFSLTGATPVLSASIPVGLEPTSVRARNNTEAWVVNNISDSVSVVSLTALNVTQTLSVGDEPYDVVFAGTPQRAFVSVAALNQVWRFDPADLAASPTTIAITGEDPRAMATDGNKVYVAIFESGNKTTVIKTTTVSAAINPYPGDPNPPPNSGTGFSPALNGANPAAPAASLIVKRMPDNSLKDDNNGVWTGAILSNMHDNDVVIIDTGTLATTFAKSLMNINMAIALRPTGGGNEVTVVGTDATNLIRFEPNLQSTFVRVMMGWFDSAAPGAVSTFDINPHLTYAVRSIPQAQRDDSIGDPRGIVWNAGGTTGYVTGMGSNNVVSIAPGGARIARADIGEGPTGIALDEARGKLYVLNKFEGSLSVVGVSPFAEVQRISLLDPTPLVIKQGRKFLFDTHLTSGLGQASCASCHVDGRMDQLAWDLGDPSGDMKAFNQVCGSGGTCENWHPLKGPLVTQTMQGIVGVEPFHWRGDREGIGAFRHAFVSILGDDADLSNPDNIKFRDYVATIAFPPNPNLLIDGSLPSLLSNGGNPITGQDLFLNAAVTGTNNATCISCHNTPSGANATIIPAVMFNGTQSMKVPHLRNEYKKTGFTNTGTNNNRGFGFLHDGTFDSVQSFLTSSVFHLPAGASGLQQRKDLEAFVFCWDTGTHAAIGRQTTLVSQAGASPAQLNLIDTMMALADANQVGLIVKGLDRGVPRGWYYKPVGVFQSDIVGQSHTAAQLLALAAPGSELTFTVVPVVSAYRMGVDRDEDGYYDRNETLAGSDPDSAASTPPPPCPGDINGDRAVNTADLTILLGSFGSPVSLGSSGDFDFNGVINTSDLTTLLGAFGSVCP